MARNILIFSDGTAMIGGLKPDQNASNVYKLYRATRTGADSPVSRQEQIAFYDAGLGANDDGSTFLNNPVKTLMRLISMALGTGISVNIADCYEIIIKYYQPGDRIFLCGFSRGAYTVRNVASVLSLCGIPEYDKDPATPFPRAGRKVRAVAEEAVRIYEHGAGKNREAYQPEREKKAERFRQQYGAWLKRGKADEDQRQSNAAPYFIGVFDTVAALGASGVKRILLLLLSIGGVLAGSLLLGWLLSLFTSASLGVAVGYASLIIIVTIAVSLTGTRLRVIQHYPQEDKPNIYRIPGNLLPTLNFRWHFISWRSKFFDRYLDNRVPYARHAIAIDEHRADFARVPWGLKGDRAEGNEALQESGPEWFRQIWFAGSHSDIGGGILEAESGLPDTALEWMVEQLSELPQSPIFNASMLNYSSGACDVGHCAVHSLKAAYPEWWPEKFRFSWPGAYRKIPNDAPLHPSVLERFAAKTVSHEGCYQPYRPAQLDKHQAVKQYYPK